MRSNSKRSYRGRYVAGTTIILVVAVLIALAVWFSNNSMKRFDTVLRPYELLTVREAFALGLKSFTVQVTPLAPLRIVGFDELRNRYAAYFTRGDQLVLEINDKRVEDALEHYRNIYVRALYSLVESNAPIDVAPADQKLLFAFLHNLTIEYTKDDTGESLVLKGLTEDGRDVQLHLSFRRAKDELRYSVRKIFLNGRELNDRERMLVLGTIYKKDIERDLLTLVKMGALSGFKHLTVEQIVEKLENLSWYIKDENQRLVELTFTGLFEEIANKPAAFALGLTVNQYGEVAPAYLYVNGSEVAQAELRNFVYYIFSKSSQAFASALRENIVEMVGKGVVSSFGITLKELLDEHFADVAWDVHPRLKVTQIKVTGTLKRDGSNVNLYFDFDGTSARLTKMDRNGRVQSPDVFFRELFAAVQPVEPTPVSTTVQAPVDPVELVKRAKLIQSSPYADNEEALRKSLSNVTWKYDEARRVVVVSGTGLYQSRRRNVSLHFGVAESGYKLMSLTLDGEGISDVVAQYILEKLFNVPGFESKLVEYVKNSLGFRKTLRQTLGETGWSIDVATDSVVFRKPNFEAHFVVDTNALVRNTKLVYAGIDYSDKRLEAFDLLERGQDLSILRKPTEARPVDRPPSESRVGTEREVPKETTRATVTTGVQTTKQPTPVATELKPPATLIAEPAPEVPVVTEATSTTPAPELPPVGGTPKDDRPQEVRPQPPGWDVGNF